MSTRITEQEWLDALFPPSRTTAFFDALFDGAEEGAYDIQLICRKAEDTCAHLAFALHQRPGKCLRCNLTYGLPEVFKRHPVIDAKGLASAIAEEAGWAPFSWELGRTEEIRDDLHVIPFTVRKG